MNKNNIYNGTKPLRTPDITCTYTYNKQFRTRTWGKQRVKYTTCNYGIGTRCVGRQDKTNGKWKVDRRWLEGRRHRPPNAAWTRRGTDFGGSRDTGLTKTDESVKLLYPIFCHCMRLGAHTISGLLNKHSNRPQKQDLSYFWRYIWMFSKARHI